MRKNHIRVLGLITVLFLLAGCSGKNGMQEDAMDEKETGRGSEEYIVVGYSQIGSESDYRIANTESFKSTFTEENGYYLLFEDAQQKQENQLKAIRNFIL